MYEVSFISDEVSDVFSEMPFIRLYYSIPEDLIYDPFEEDSPFDTELDKKIRHYIKTHFRNCDSECCEIEEPGSYLLASSFEYGFDWSDFPNHLTALSKKFPKVVFILNYHYAKGIVTKLYLQNGLCFSDTSKDMSGVDKLSTDTEIVTYKVED